MRNLITKSLELFSYLVIFLLIIGAGMSGAAQSGIGGFFLGIFGGAIMSIVIFGALFILMDISDNTRRTVELLEQQNRS